MESLQLAQMLADLNNLNATEARAAADLVNANKAISKPSSSQTAPAAPSASSTPGQGAALSPPQNRHHQRVASASESRTHSPLDSLSRRLLTPPITRSNSNHGSVPGTPRETEGDVDRASTLMSLYEIRAKLKQQDNTGLNRAREKLAALAAKQQAQTSAGERKDASSAPPKTQSPYSYPKQT